MDTNNEKKTIPSDHTKKPYSKIGRTLEVYKIVLNLGSLITVKFRLSKKKKRIVVEKYSRDKIGTTRTAKTANKVCGYSDTREKLSR